MPLEILLPLVVLGVPLIVWLARLTGAEKESFLLTASSIKARLKRERDDFACNDMLIAADQHAALATDPDSGETGLVFVFGDKTVARLFTAGQDTKIEDKPSGLRLSFKDFTLPDLDITLNEDEKSLWKQRLSA